jgi:hypothetical protein
MKVIPHRCVMETYSVNAILETAATNICLPEQCGAKHESGKVQRITDERLCKLPSSGHPSA